jgi:hypothetical protein
MKKRIAVATPLLALFAAQPAYAQDEEVISADSEEYSDEVIATGQRTRGVAIGEIEPEYSIDSAEVRAYGASSFEELLAALGPMLRTTGGRSGVAVLVNGRRVSGFREIRQYPPEAIERVDILPEEAAVRYGFRPDQRVINFVLRQRFRALTLEGEAGAATEGGRYSGEADATRLRIARDRRWSIDGEIEFETALVEDERDIARGAQAGDIVGNVYSNIQGGEIDPALSALAGATATVAGAPSGAADGAVPLAAFAPNAPNVTDVGPYRTLRPRSEKASLAAAYNDRLFSDVSATLAASFDYERQNSLRGLADAAAPLPQGSPFSPFAADAIVERLFVEQGALKREQESWDAQASAVFNSAPSELTWSVTAKLQRKRNETNSERGVDATAFAAATAAGANPFAPAPTDQIPIILDRATSVRDQARLDSVFNLDLASLPAGALAATANLAGGGTWLKADDSRTGEQRLSRGESNAQLSLEAPILKEGATAAPFGDVSASASLRHDYYSDFGSLYGYGGSLTWKPIEHAQLVGSFNVDEFAPSIEQLGDPIITTANVRVFDFATGKTLDTVTQISGGAPGLSAERRRALRINYSHDLLKEQRLNFLASYSDTRVDNAISVFPGATPDAEAAFPSRFTRDAAGDLIRIDARPVNYSETRRRDLRYGFNWSIPLKSKAPDLSDEERARLREIMRPRSRAPEAEPAPPPTTTRPPGGAPAEGAPRSEAPLAGGASGGGLGGGPRGGGGFRRGGMFGPGGGSTLIVSAFHTVAFDDSALPAPNAARLDLLDGSSLSPSGGPSRHEVEARLGGSYRGFSGFAEYRWKSATRIDGGASGAIAFSDIGTINLRLNFDPSQRPRLLLACPALRGSRLSLRIDNVLNARQSAKDSFGAVPINYQSELIDPVGRVVRVSFRKSLY